jgi:hypothetical protein
LHRQEHRMPDIPTNNAVFFPIARKDVAQGLFTLSPEPPRRCQRRPFHLPFLVVSSSDRHSSRADDASPDFLFVPPVPIHDGGRLRPRGHGFGTAAWSPAFLGLSSYGADRGELPLSPGGHTPPEDVGA